MKINNFVMIKKYNYIYFFNFLFIFSFWSKKLIYFKIKRKERVIKAINLFQTMTVINFQKIDSLPFPVKQNLQICRKANQNPVFVKLLDCKKLYFFVFEKNSFLISQLIFQGLETVSQWIANQVIFSSTNISNFFLLFNIYKK